MEKRTIWVKSSCLITIPNDIEDEEAISDYISDVTGFCHKGFELEEQL